MKEIFQEKQPLILEPGEKSTGAALGVIENYLAGGDAFSEKTIDLSSLENEQILNLLHDLEKKNLFVFHGSPKEKQKIINIQKSLDSHNEEGRQNGVYASVIPEDALFYSFLDKDFFREKNKNTSLGVGTNTETRKVVIMLDKVSFDLYKKNRNDFLKDSYLYILDNTDFKLMSNKGPIEKISRNNHIPVLTFKIPKKLADGMLIENETVLLAPVQTP